MKKLLFLILFCTVSQSPAAEIIGRVLEYDSLEPLIGVGIDLDSVRYITSSNIEGYFSINNLPTGIHIITIRMIGYNVLCDTIKIKSDTTIFNKDYIIREYGVDLEEFPECEQYHQQLQEIAKYQDIFEIKIKKKIKRNALLLQLELKNKTSLPLYISESVELWFNFFVVVYNSKGENMYCHYCISGNDSSFNQPYPDSSTLIIIPPYSIVKYPKIATFPYEFTDYPKDTYTIKVKYYNERLEYLYLLYPGQVSRENLNESKKVLSFLLRGEYWSTNSVTFNNTKRVNAFLKWKKKQEMKTKLNEKEHSEPPQF
ncbi:MAG TPA: carboxypeptidase-like regulatory domain-containing protein [bacterium]|nr:carboxypeptidase-like regulatory domain-containing protein [bacterium]HPN45462.1 carboxypeptidase-like regulatory domain-containing protein [bacterium]